jgi:hypothetical protein
MMKNDYSCRPAIQFLQFCPLSSIFPREQHPPQFLEQLYGQGKRIPGTELTTSQVRESFSASKNIVHSFSPACERNDPLYQLFHAKAPFNVYDYGTEQCFLLQRFGPVISTSGAVTPFHYDDVAAINIAGWGRKIWFMAHIEEAEECGLNHDDKLDLSQFLSLRSSRWCVVEKGQLLISSPMYLHRVYTSDNYIGLGAFWLPLSTLVPTILQMCVCGAISVDISEIEMILNAAQRALRTASSEERLFLQRDLESLQRNRYRVRDEEGETFMRSLKQFAFTVLNS